MRKLLFLVLLAFVSTACDKDKSEVRIWTVASEKGVTGVQFGFGFVPANIVREDDGQSWRAFAETIEGFTFEEGYESVIRVRIDPVPDPPADGSDRRITMEQLISRTPAQSVDKTDFSPEIELALASERGMYYEFPCYWIKDLRYQAPRWEPLPIGIEGFAYEPGNEYRLKVRVSAEKDATSNNGYGIRFTLLEELDKTEKNSERLP